MVERCRRRWNFVHPYRLSNRSLPRPEIKSRVTENVGVKESDSKGKSSEGPHSTSVEAARLRFLQRKMTKKL
jgi:hypothetical protein